MKALLVYLAIHVLYVTLSAAMGSSVTLLAIYLSGAWPT